MKKVLILGGGFAGVEAAIHLCKKGFNVTLVSNRDYIFVYPVSIWIPVRKREFGDVCIKLNDLKKKHGFDVIVDEVQEINVKENKVSLKNHTLTYDYLLIAIGANKVKHKGIENTLSICGEPEQSLLLRKRLDELVEKGSGKIAMGFGGNPKDPSGVRGGPAFELLFNVHNFLKKKGLRENFELTFFAPMPKPGIRMGERALKMIDIFFEKLNFKKQVGKKIKEFVTDGVIFEDDTKLDSDLTMFIPAGSGHKVLENSDLPLNPAGFVIINEHCQVEFVDRSDSNKSNVFAIGDVAALEGPDWKAKQGHIAEVMARTAAYNISAIEKGKSKRKSYVSHINILCVMYSGNGASFVFRNEKRAWLIPMPIFGHWLKKGWGFYYRQSKLGRMLRIPGM